MRILHVGFDSHFVDYLVARFERIAPGCNELILVSHSELIDRVGEFHGPRDWVQPRAEHVAEVLQRAQEADVVVAHAMTEFTALVCAQLPPGVVLVWSGFGYDYYVGQSGEGLIGELTRDLVRLVSGGREVDRNGRLLLEWEEARIEPVALDLVKQFAAARADYFSAPVDADFEVFRQAFPGFRGEYRQLNYGDVASMCRAGDAVATGDDILLGNSASWANNHLEAFRLLAKCELGSRRVVVPLTYGDAGYRDAVLDAGRRKLGERFFPIVDHMPIEEYLDLMSSCRIAVFNHRRQQGLGNIVAALQQGSFVYLDRRNPLFDWFRSHGVRVRPTGSLRKGLPDQPVLPSALEGNRKFIAQTWSTESVETNLRLLIADIEARLNASARRARRRRGLLARRVP